MHDAAIWIFTKYGFYSVVCARQGNGSRHQPADPDRLMVRARRREHLERLQSRFSDVLGPAEIKVYQGTDYPVRLFVEKAVWTQVSAELAAELDYDNFKAEVGESLKDQPDSGPYLDSLHRVWEVMVQIER